nr:MAG TPA: hypothetical protein [Caudoviricetes sp.]
MIYYLHKVDGGRGLPPVNVCPSGNLPVSKFPRADFLTKP